MHMGGWFSFNSPKDEWKSYYARNMFDTFFNYGAIVSKFGGIKISDELLITKNLQYSAIKGKNVLVVGGGPSSKGLDKDIISNYDYIFSCNHFFKNNLLKENRVTLALLSDEVSLRDPELLSYLEEHKTLIGLEHSSRRDINEIIEFKERHKRTFVYLTRYFSRLGFVPRAIVLAALFEANKISFAGLDGFSKNSKNFHFFENFKKPPSFNNEQLFKSQMKVFYKYLLNDLGVKANSLLDYGASHEANIYKGILQEVLNEKN